MVKRTFNFESKATFYADAGTELRTVMRRVNVVTPQGTAQTFLPEIQVRKDIWADWLHDAVDAAEAAADAASRPIEALLAPAAGGPQIRREMRQAMRAATGVAFALDGFYAAVKARAGAHPNQVEWSARRRPPARYIQTFETLRYHLKVSGQEAKAARDLFRRSFKLRDLAVHPTATFRPLALRHDLGETCVEWHYSVFHAQDACSLVDDALGCFRSLVEHLPRSTNERLSKWAYPAKEVIEVEAAYTASSIPRPSSR